MSSTNLSSLSACLRQLESEKALERKKEANALKDFLTKKSIIDALDRNTDTKRKFENKPGENQTKLITWDTVFNRIKGFINIETRKLGPQTGPLNSKAAVVKQTCCMLFKLVVEKANSRGPQLKAKSILNMVFRVMEDVSLRLLFGSEFTSVLLKQVLQVHSFMVQLPPSSLLKLFEVYVPHFSSPPSGWSKTVLHELLRLLLNVSKISTSHPKELVQLFEKIFSNIRHETPTNTHDGWLAALLTFCRKAAVSLQTYICDLGKKLLLPFLHFWNNRPTESAKTHLLEFFYIQLILHHPSGKWSVDESAFTSDSVDTWAVNIRELCETLLQDCEKVADRGTLTIGKDQQLRPELLCTLVEVCHLVFPTKYVSVNNSSAFMAPSTWLNQTQSSSGVYPKRRRGVLHFSSLLEPLKNYKNPNGVLPWLQLISALLQKYPEVVDISDLVTLMENLHVIDLSTHQTEHRPLILKCWCAVVKAYAKNKSPSTTGTSANHTWKKLYDSMLRMIALNQCHEDSHALLCELIHYKLVTPQSDFYRLYLPGSNNYVSESSLKTICMYLLNYSLPSKYTKQVSSTTTAAAVTLTADSSISSESSGRHWFRYQLLQWVLNGDTADSLDSLRKSETFLPLLAHFLLFLCVQNGKPSFLSYCTRNSQTVFPENWEWTKDLQHNLLKMSFDVSEENFHLKSENIMHTGTKRSRILQAVYDFLLSAVFFKAGLFRDSCQELSSCDIRNHICFIFHIMEASLFQGVMTADDLISSRLGETIMSLMKKLTDSVKNEKENALDTMKTLETLTSSNMFIEIPATIYVAMTNCLASLIPDETFEFMLHLLTDYSQEYSTAVKSPSGGILKANQLNGRSQIPSSIHHSNSSDDLMDMEDSFDIAEDCIEISSISDTTFIERKDGIQAYSPTHLKIAGFLCKVFFHSVVGDHQRERILKLLNCDEKNLESPPHVHLLLHCLNILAEREPEYALDSIREILKTHEVDLDGSWYIQCLSVLKLCVPYVASLSNSESQEPETRKTFFFILDTFWNREQQQQNDSKVSQTLVHLTVVFLQKLLTGGNSDSSVTISSWTTNCLKKLMSLLTSPDPEMCLTVANSFALLIEDLPQELHQTFFQEWYAHIMGSDKSNMEDSARNSSLLTSLYHLSTLGGLIERQALFTFLQATRSKGISVSLLQKVFGLLSKNLGFSSSISMVQFHICYLLSEWLNSGYPLVEFPFQILHCSTSSQFYRENTSLIVRILFDQLDVEAIKELGKVIGRDWISILKESLPSIMSHLISWFAVPQDSCPEWQKKQKIATEGHKLLEQMLSSEVVQREITERLHELVIGILLLLHNENCPSVLKPLNLKLPPPNPTSFPPDVILNAFKYLIESKSGTLNTSLFSVLMESDHTLVNVMLSLRVHLFEATRIDEECRIVLVYQLLVELLIPDLSPVQHHSSFILRELLALSVTQLNRVSIKGARSSVRGLYVYLLTTVIEGTVDRLNEEIHCFLPKIVDSLLVVLEENPKVDSMVCRLLEIIFLEKHAFLVDTLKILDPLPKLPCLNRVYQQQQRIRGRPVTLDEALKKFWLSFKRTHGKPRVEALEELLGHIQEKKLELNKMVEFFQTNHMYAEDLAKSPFHLVISALIKLCSTGTDEIQQMCAKCLGEIGPVELGTPLLCPVDVLLEDTFDQELRGLEKCYLFIFKSLIDFLHDSRIEVVTASAGVLKNVLKTKTGQEFILFSRAKKLRSLLKYLVPFSSRSKVKKPSVLQTDVGNFSVLVDSFQLWVPNSGTHKEWLETLICTLIDAGCSGYEIFPLLKPLCKVEVSFNEKFLPFLIHAILLSSCDQKIQEILSSQISNFFSKHCQLEKSSHSKESSQNSSDQGNADLLVVQSRPSVQTVLNVIQYLRRQIQKQFTAPARDCNYWLNVDYLDIAIAAQFCGQHFTALCYIELWRDNCNSPTTSSQSSDSSSQDMFSNLLPLLSSRHSTYRAAVIQQILLKSYKQIGDKDGLYGCTMLFEDSLSLQTSLFELDNRWDRILQVHDSGAATVATSSGPPTQENCGNILKALQKCGLNHTLQGYLMGVLLSSPAQQMPSTELLEFQCECAWRLGNWDLVLPETESSHGVHQSLFKGLVCLPSKEYLNAQEELCAGRKQALMNMKLVSSKEQASYSLLLSLSDFRLFSLVQSALDFLQSEQNDDGGSLNNLLNIWSSVNKIPFHEFEFIEPSLCLQSRLLQQFASTFPSASSAFTSSLEQLLTLARQQGHLQVADQTLQRLLSVQTECGEQNLRWRVEAARNRWNRGEMASARQILKTLLKTLERQQEESCENASLYAETLMQLGQWQAESCFESPATILTDFLEKALHLLEPLQSQSKNCLWEGHLCVARYADLRFQEIRKHQQSQAFLLKKQIMKEAVEKAQKLRENRNPTDDPNSRKKAINTLLKQSEIDESEIKDLEKEAEEMLIKAIKSYLCCLKGTDAHDLRAFRVIALWFQNYQDQQVCQLIEEEMANVQTYKFLPLIHQLAARMGTSDSAHFKRTLQKVIFRMCKDHPYHSMPVIMALCHADKDAPNSGNAGSRRQKSVDGNSQQARQETAKKIIVKLKSWAPLQEYVQQLEFLCLAYIKLAYYEQKCAGPIPDSCHLLKNQYFNKVPVITEDIKVDKSLQYNSLVHVSGFDQMFRFVGGINSPKVITCLGSDGRKRQQLVKGQDDLRQDAVMQQVFTLVNRLLKKDPEALKRKLSIRTYKVVPLSSRSGVLQWCDGTTPIGIYLAGPSYRTGAHKIYNPKEITAAQGREYLDLSKDKLSAYLEICKKFTPVFRYFFLENFPDPSVWYERRLAYTRSVSTCSIVGYILGLGDRHVQNILLDKRTAEVIHIDFGVAFEQGRILPTPETVPFRLTRDLVDGLGIAGVEGVFRRCCEKSMEVMRASQEALLTILEVLLYDPLYVWSISPQEAISHQRRQDQFSTDNSGSPTNGQAQNIDISRLSPDPSSGGPEVNKLAERVLLRLREKLLGVEDSVALSVPGQVSLLIQQAVDPRNLSKLFAGWQPHL